MGAMVISTARVSGVRRGSAADRAREAWFAGSSGPHAAGVPTPRRARPDVAPGRAVHREGAVPGASTGRPADAAVPRTASGPRTGAARRQGAPSRDVQVASAEAVRTRTAGAQLAGADERPLRLTRRGRLVVLLLGLLVLAGGVQGGQALADGPSRALEVTSYTVAAGETLWEIAAAQAHRGEDVRDVVLELQSLNGLRSAGLAAGQQIILPAQR